MDIGNILKVIRKERKLTLKELGRRADVHANTVNRIEKGQHGATFGAVERIALALGYELELMEIQKD